MPHSIPASLVSLALAVQGGEQKAVTALPTFSHLHSTPLTRLTHSQPHSHPIPWNQEADPCPHSNSGFSKLRFLSADGREGGKHVVIVALELGALAGMDGVLFGAESVSDAILTGDRLSFLSARAGGEACVEFLSSPPAHAKPETRSAPKGLKKASASPRLCGESLSPPLLKSKLTPMPKSLEELQVIAKRVRRAIVEMIGAAGSGHPGASPSAVKPLDLNAIRKAAETGAIAVAEEHLVDGGLGVRVAQAVAQIHPCAMEFVGIQNTYAESGEPMQLLNKYGLTAPHIVDAVRKVLARKR